MRPRLDPINQCLWWDDRRVELSANAFRLLRYLVARPQQLVTKHELLDAVWPDAHVVDAVLSVTVSQLREAFDDDARRPRFIETVYGRGYRWVGELADEVPADTAAADAPLVVGRAEALAELVAAAARAAGGRRQLVFVTGDPGIGKSTLVDYFLAAVPARDGLIGRGQCIDAYGMDEPYMPLLEALRQLLHGSDAAIEALRSQAPTWLLQLPGLLSSAEHDALQRGLASSTGTRMMRELQLGLEALAAEQPIVLVLEDLHWSDTATVAALAGLALRREAAKLLIIATYRPIDAIAELHPIVQLKHELTAKRQASELTLDGLDVDAIGAYLAVRFTPHAFPSELAVRLHAQTSGNPLFLLNAIEDLEQRHWLQRVDGTWQCTVAPAQLDAAVPESTRAMIDARLGQVQPATLELLEAASVIGAHFASQTLAAMLDRDAGSVERDCTALARSGQFLREIEPVGWPDGSHSAQYAFRHALYEQVLSRRVTGARRQRWHRAAAARLERGFGDQVGELAAALARHYERGGDLDRAVTFHGRAAELARSRYSFEQAAAQLRHALDLLGRLPASAGRDAREIDLQSELITTIYSTDGPGAAELERIASRIDVLSQDGETTPALLNSLFGLIGLSLTRGDLPRAEAACARARQRAADAGWSFYADVARGLFGFTQHRRGHFTAAIPELEAGAALPLVGASGMMEPSIGCASDLGFTHVVLGELRRGLAIARDADARALATGHPPTIVYSAGNMMRIAQMLGDHPLVESIATRMGELGERLASPRCTAVSLLSRGWLGIDAGAAEGFDLFQQAIDIYRAHSHLSYGPFSSQQLSAGLLRVGRLDAARAALDEAFAQLDATQARWCEAELHRTRGDLAAAGAAALPARGKRRQTALRDAEQSYRRAIEIARSQGARWWELFGWYGLARLWPAEVRGDAMRSLRALHAAVDDGLDVTALREIRALLA
jgi:DNA-binding winged helix-turn-helix (wHTH) protein/tetratricopeptide (TPR) repeat protein